VKTDYHFTSWDAWRKIQRTGLRPQVMTEVLAQNPSLARELKDTPVVCFYPRRLRGLARWGQVIWTMTRRQTPHVVCLSFPYEKKDVFDPDRGDSSTHTTISHDGRIGTNYNSFVYHRHEPLHMLTVAVPPEVIRVEQEWKLD